MGVIINLKNSIYLFGNCGAGIIRRLNTDACPDLLPRLVSDCKPGAIWRLGQQGVINQCSIEEFRGLVICHTVPVKIIGKIDLTCNHLDLVAKQAHVEPCLPHLDLVGDPDSKCLRICIKAGEAPHHLIGARTADSLKISKEDSRNHRPGKKKEIQRPFTKELVIFPAMNYLLEYPSGRAPDSHLFCLCLSNSCLYLLGE